MSEQDLKFLHRAVELARDAKSTGNPPFGSLLVGHDGVILAEAINTTVVDDDATAHPELKLAAWAAKSLSLDEARRTTLYTSTENCAMCSGAFVIAGLGRLVFAISGDQLRTVRAEAGGQPPQISAADIFKSAKYPIVVEGPLFVDEGLAVHL